MDFENVLLEPEQEELLCRVVEAHRNVPKDQRRRFIVSQTLAGDHLVHRGLKEDQKIFVGDVEALASEGLIQLSYSSSGSRLFSVAPLGFQYNEYLKQKVGQPLQRTEKEVRHYIDSEEFQKRYPMAHQKWTDAEARLWRSDSERELTTIGHLCREAMQEFADALARRQHLPLEKIDPDKARTVARLKAIVQSRFTSDKKKAFFEALIVYWGTVSDLVQRQEHGGQKENEPVNWEDARRVVFQTVLVMYEIDRAPMEENTTGGRNNG